MNNSNEKQKFDFKQFIEDSKIVLFNSKEYFSKMQVTGGFGEPVIKALIYGIVIGIFNYLWILMGVGFSGAPSWFGGEIGIMTFLGMIVFSVIGLFIGGIIMLIISAILGGNTDYETNVRVVASLMVIRVVGSALGFFNGINLYLGAIVSIAVSLWGLYITYYALTLTLKAGEKGAKILLAILAVIVVITSFTSISSKRVLKKLHSRYQGEIEKEVTEEVKTTKETHTKYVKPDEFPEEILTELSDVLSDKSYLDDITLNKTLQMFYDIQHSKMENMSDEQKKAKLDSIASAYDFKNFEDVLNNSVKPALFSVTVLSIIAKTKEQTGSKVLLKGILSQNPISLQDIRFTYDNWDKVILLEKIVAK